MKRVGVFGGMFDPVHYGHLRSAYDVFEQAGLDVMRFVPCAKPAHRAMPVASADDRVAMLERALDGYPEFELDLREIQRGETSYMVDTLEDMRRDMQDAHLVLLLGEDSFAGFGSWHRWQDILGMAQLAVMHRPGSWTDMPADIAAVVGQNVVAKAEFARSDPGSVAFFDVTPLDISSTDIRLRLAAGSIPRFLLPDAVIDYLRDWAIYGKAN